MIRAAAATDAGAIADIYNHFVQHTTVTFEETPVPDTVMAERLAETFADRLPFLVAVPDGAVEGFAYASKWKGRCAYRFSSEVTVYLRPGAEGRGLGSALYAALIPQLKAQGIHALLGGIALPNASSVALHEKFGFTNVAHFREVGRKFDRWVDVGYWQLVL
ncbi:MAG: phosphinothricin N-acetyltransferase [Acidimicrobiia bacterium]|jgi:phosphinothricin acetyltransferase